MYLAFVAIGCVLWFAHLESNPIAWGVFLLVDLTDSSVSSEDGWWPAAWPQNMLFEGAFCLGLAGCGYVIWSRTRTRAWLQVGLNAGLLMGMVVALAVGCRDANRARFYHFMIGGAADLYEGHEYAERLSEMPPAFARGLFEGDLNHPSREYRFHAHAYLHLKGKAEREEEWAGSNGGLVWRCDVVGCSSFPP